MGALRCVFIFMFTFGVMSSAVAQDDEVAIVDYVIENRISLSTVLYSHGIGVPGSPYKLYGLSGWLEKTKKLNPHIKDWDRLPAGTHVRLAVPKSHVARPHAPQEDQTPGESSSAHVPMTPSPSVPAPTPVYFKPAPSDLTAVDVTAVKQAATFGTLMIRTSGSQSLNEPAFIAENSIRLGNYLAGDIFVLKSMRGQSFQSRKNPAQNQGVDYKTYILTGRVLMPTDDAVWSVRGGFLKSGINTPWKEGVTEAAHEFRGDAPFVPVLGFGASESPGGKLLWDASALATKWKELTYLRVSVNFTYRILPTWYIGPLFFHEKVDYLPKVYEGTNATFVGLTFGFGMSQ